LGLTHFSRCFRARLHGHDVEGEVAMMNEAMNETMSQLGLR